MKNLIYYIGNAVRSATTPPLSDQQKLEFYENYWRPEPGQIRDFQSEAGGRKFYLNNECLATHNWLAVSKKDMGIYCRL